jgi:hypothetical protein
LQLGALSIGVFAGYQCGETGYALPVANAALAREWASGSGLAWQVGYNYSTVPVRLDMEHRQPLALKGRVEVATQYGYADTEEPQGHETVVSREFLVPPSVPTSLMLMPRFCPPSQPGSVTSLTVRIFQHGIQQPIYEQQHEVLQMEPLHLYSLLLDGLPGQIKWDIINAGNHLELTPELEGRHGRFKLAPELVSSHHYTLSCDRRQVTLAALAARNFAFVVADATQLQGWPLDEQQALAEYVVGGGYLCLFNASGEWQGLSLERGPQLVGRGVLLPVGGDFSAARHSMTRWLEGELSELVLLCGGAVGGNSLDYLRDNVNILDELNLQGTLAEVEGDIVSHRPGFMHPIWIYRETCRQSALDPWDYPEFARGSSSIIADNRNLRMLVNRQRSASSSQSQLRPLVYCLDDVRNWPAPFGWIALALPLGLLVGGAFQRRHALGSILVVLIVATGGWFWWQAQPIVKGQPRVVLIDATPQVNAAVQRSATAVQSGRSKVLEVNLAEDVLLRHVRWSPPGSWRLDTTREGTRWYGDGGGGYAVLSTESPVAAPVCPVNVNAARVDDNRVQLEIDTAALRPDQASYLLTSRGWLVLPGGAPRIMVELRAPRDQVWPGYQRLAAWDQHQCSASIVNRGNRLIRQLAITGNNPDMTPLERLGWLGIVQNPMHLRGLLKGQGVIYTPLDNDAPWTQEATSGERTAVFMRWAFPLDDESSSPAAAGEGP